jgi:hypothetical protein
MTHALLLNPFNTSQFSSTQESAQSSALPTQFVSRQTLRATRSTPVCAICQSDDIIVQATAQWSNEQQAWELAATFDQPAHCVSCNGPCGIVWLPLR